MTRDSELPTDPDALRALPLVERHTAEVAQLTGERDRLSAIIEALQRHRFDRRSERLNLD